MIAAHTYLPGDLAVARADAAIAVIQQTLGELDTLVRTGGGDTVVTQLRLLAEDHAFQVALERLYLAGNRIENASAIHAHETLRLVIRMRPKTHALPRGENQTCNIF